MIRTSTGVEMSKSSETPFQPQILKRPTQSPPKPQQPSARAQPVASTFAPQPNIARIPPSPSAVLPTASGLLAQQGSFGMPQSPTAIKTSGSSFPAQPDPRNSQAAEHKQTLLSLFGKSQATPTSPPRRTDPIEPSMMASSRSRVGSLASGGDGTSRRGSQTPISPADKGFLLGYLDAVAKGSR
jgi:mRNA-decapping enzyme subunit 2